MGSKSKMVNRALAIAEDDSHGYSQSVRWGPDYDCSSLVYDAAEAGGYDISTSDPRYTGTILDDFTAAGFTAIPFSNVGLGGLDYGDILLNVVHHTEMYVGGGNFVGAHSSETGCIYGQPGDQTGNEISVVPAYVYWAGWDYVLRPPADNDDAHQVPGEPVNDEGFLYRSHVQNLGWLDPVRDGQTSGTVGYSLRLEAFKITPPSDEWELDAKVHEQGIGWVEFDCIERGESSGEGSSKNDPIIGTVGESRRIEAVQIDVVRAPEGKTIEYQVHEQDTGWKSWTPAGHPTGSDGQSRRIEAIRIKVVDK